MTSRLKVRCFATSALVHGGLLALLLFAPGFRRPDLEAAGAGPPLELVPGELIDQALAAAADGASASKVQPEPVPPSPVVERPPAPEPEAPPPRHRETPAPSPVHIDAPVTPEAVFKLPSSQNAEKTAPRARRPERDPPKVDLSKAKSLRPEPTRQRPAVADPGRDREAAADTARARRRDLLQSFASAAGSLEGTTKPGSLSIQISGASGGAGGGGGGGSAYAWQVRNAYNNAWLAPQNVRDDLATVDVEVVIRRDGSVASARVTRKSGIAALDKSVQDALDRVKEVAPFEAGASDEERNFSIGFNLRGRRSF